MIIKKIANKKKSASKRERIHHLSDYIVAPNTKNKNEKCIYSNTRGFLCDSFNAKKAEMLALADEVTKSPDTINHYVVSWQADEKPSIDNIEAAVDIILQELGVEDHQVIYGLHDDTDNRHLHIMLNRASPYSYQCVDVDKGFGFDKLHKAIAKIEHSQGWKRETNGRFMVNAFGKIEKCYSNKDRPKPIKQKAIVSEIWSGEKSAIRIAQELIDPLLKSGINTWQELHQILSDNNMRYIKKGGGAVVFVGDIAIKASDISRQSSLSKLSKVLGEFIASTEKATEKHTSQPTDNGHALYQYQQFIKALKSDKDEPLNQLKAKQQEAINLLKLQQKQERDEGLSGDWTGRGVILNAMRSVIADKQKIDTAVLKAQHKEALSLLKETRGNIPSFEEWQRSNMAVSDRPTRVKKQVSAVDILGHSDTLVLPNDQLILTGNADAADEIEGFKAKINLVNYAVSMGYRVNKAESFENAKILEKGLDKIMVVTDKNGHGVYFSVHDESDNGSIIDFIAKRQQANLGQIINTLRSFKELPDRPALKKPKSTTKEVQRFSRHCAAMVLQAPDFLVDDYKINGDILSDHRFSSKIRIDPYGHAVFPHENNSGLCGYEFNKPYNAGSSAEFSVGGQKGLWLSSDARNVRKTKTFVFCDNAIDALSHAQLHQNDSAYLSFADGLNDDQRCLITSLIQQSPQFGISLVFAVGNHKEGDDYLTFFSDLADKAGARYSVDRPDARFKGWNDALRNGLSLDEEEDEEDDWGPRW